MELYRLFIAAELPANVKAELVDAQTCLRQANLLVSWVAPKAMHLTLRFLGDTSVAQIPEIERAIRAGLAPHSAMALRLSGLGAFPNERRPNVVWVGVGGAVAALLQAQAAIEAALGRLAITPDLKPFRPHLTLGRLQRGADLEQQQRLGDAIRTQPAPAPLEWAVEKVVLFRSELRRHGPIYTEVDAIILSQNSGARKQESE